MKDSQKPDHASLANIVSRLRAAVPRKHAGAVTAPYSIQSIARYGVANLRYPR